MATVKVNIKSKSNRVVVKETKPTIKIYGAGKRGLPGPDGADGPDGASAYQVWLDLGNVGTEQDFLDSLQGEPGVQGNPGNDGLIQSVVAGDNVVVDNTDPANPIVSSIGGGDVESVNGQTGVVELDKSDIGLGNVDNTSDANKPISSATQTALNAKADLSALTSHTSNTSNPHSVTKTQVGLSNVDNTSDADKPVSTATQTALDNKVDKVVGKGLSTEDYSTAEKSKLAGVAAGATANSSDATLLARANHTGTQSADTITDGTTNKAYTAVEKTKLSGIATGAEVNVNADWDSVSGDSQILNKPTLGTAAAQNSTAFATAAQGTKADTALQGVVAGGGISVDNTNPTNPVISTSESLFEATVGTGGTYATLKAAIDAGAQSILVLDAATVTEVGDITSSTASIVVQGQSPNATIDVNSRTISLSGVGVVFKGLKLQFSTGSLSLSGASSRILESEITKTSSGSIITLTGSYSAIRDTVITDNYETIASARVTMNASYCQFINNTVTYSDLYTGGWLATLSNAYHYLISGNKFIWRDASTSTPADNESLINVDMADSNIINNVVTGRTGTGRFLATEDYNLNISGNYVYGFKWALWLYAASQSTNRAFNINSNQFVAQDTSAIYIENGGRLNIANNYISGTNKVIDILGDSDQILIAGNVFRTGDINIASGVTTVSITGNSFENGAVVNDSGTDTTLVQNVGIANDPSGGIDSVVGGTNITIDNTDPSNPIINGSAGGSGDVVGPASSSDNYIALFSGTTGKLLKQTGSQPIANFPYYILPGTAYISQSYPLSNMRNGSGETTYGPNFNVRSGNFASNLSANFTVNAPTNNYASSYGLEAVGQKFLMAFSDNGTPRTITWNSVFYSPSSGGATLPTTTVTGKTLIVELMYTYTLSASGSYACMKVTEV